MPFLPEPSSRPFHESGRPCVHAQFYFFTLSCDFSPHVTQLFQPRRGTSSLATVLDQVAGGAALVDQASLTNRHPIFIQLHSALHPKALSWERTTRTVRASGILMYRKFDRKAIGLERWLFQRTQTWFPTATSGNTQFLGIRQPLLEHACTRMRTHTHTNRNKT